MKTCKGCALATCAARVLLPALLVVGLIKPGLAGDDPLVRLRPELERNVLTLQRFLPGSTLRFRSDGLPIGPAQEGSWTLYSHVGIQKTALKERKLELEGERFYIEFVENQPTSITHHDKVRIEIGFETPPCEDDIRAALDRVFIPKDRHLSDYAPEMWKHFLREQETGVKEPIAPSGPISKIGGGVSAPKAIYSPDPEYTEIGKIMKLNGSPVFWMVLNEDGRPSQITVQRPLGLGLDENAAAKIATWTFNPSRNSNGEPVKVRINVEVNFRIY